MIFKHLFKAVLKWNQTSTANRKSIKTHSISFEDKEALTISAAKAFKGDPTLHNPEDLLLSSLMSCHMMSYLYVCAQHKIEVLAYTDSAVATLETNEKGSGKFTEVHLFPSVVITNPAQIDLANALHQQANKLCFIANSCNFPVLHTATCKTV